MESPAAEDAVQRILPVDGEHASYIGIYAILLVMGRQWDILRFCNNGFSDLHLPITSSLERTSRFPNDWSDAMKEEFSQKQWEFCPRVFDADWNKGLVEANSHNDNDILPSFKIFADEENSSKMKLDLGPGGLGKAEVAPSSLCREFQDLLRKVS